VAQLERVGHAPKASLGQTLKRTFAEYKEDNFSDWAAALTYYGVLAVGSGRRSRGAGADGRPLRRDVDRSYDLITKIAAEEFGHIELVAATINAQHDPLRPPRPKDRLLEVTDRRDQRGTNCLPIAPVIPATNTLMINSMFRGLTAPQDEPAAPAATPQPAAPAATPPRTPGGTGRVATPGYGWGASLQPSPRAKPCRQLG
jgi:hypothetical protein